MIAFKEISYTFHTTKIAECKDFYVAHFGATVAFDHSWYVTIHFDPSFNPYLYLSFMAPQHPSDRIATGGVTLNMLVEDVDAEYAKIQRSGLSIVRPIGDQPWGDRSFTLHDPLGNVLYIYSPREMTGEYKAAVKEEMNGM